MLQIRDLGAIGIVSGIEPHDLPINAFSDGINVRFEKKKVQRAPIHRIFFNNLTGTAPVALFGVFNLGGYDALIYANNDGRLFKLANGSETEVTETGHTNSVASDPYTATQLAQVIYFNRPDVVPRALLPNTAAFVNLPNWDATWRCAALRSFSSYLIALNVTKGINNYPQMVKWSDTALAGSVPASWDATDTTKLAGENTLAAMKNPIVDGAVLGNMFVIYSHDEAWKMVESGDHNIFNFDRLPFDNSGIVNANCVVEIDGKHYVWGPNDIYVHDGVTKLSIIDPSNREKFFAELDSLNYRRFFVAHDRVRHELLFCGVSANANAAISHPSLGCNYAAVFNYVSNTWSFVDLPNVTAATLANANTVYTWDSIPVTWDNTGGAWSDLEDGYSRFLMFTVAPDSANGITPQRVTVLDSADHYSRLAFPLDTQALHPAWVMRQGITASETGIPLPVYKVVKQLSPLIDTFTPGAALKIEVGGHKTTRDPPVFTSSQTFDPKSQYKIDVRRGGRYLAYRITMIGAYDFDLTGFDADVMPTAAR